MKQILYITMLTALFSCNPFAGQEDGSTNMTRVITYIANPEEVAKPVYSIKGKLKSPDGKPVQSASMNVSSSALSTSTSMRATTDNGTSIVSEKAPGSVDFVDLDPTKGKIGGPVRFLKASDETGIDYYSLYWADSNKAKIKRIAKFRKTGLDFLYVFPLGSKPPEKATNLLVNSGSDASGESNSVSTKPITDTQARFTTNDAGEYDMSLEPGSFSVKIVSKDGKELGEISVTLPEKVDANTPPPKPVAVSGDMVMTVTSFGVSGSNTPAIEQKEPANAASAIAFTDTNYQSGTIAGTISITRAVDESDIDSYVLYFGSDATTKLGDALTTIAKTGSDLSYSLTTTTIPTGATHFLVFTKNEIDEMTTGISLAISDTIGTSKEITAFSFTSPAITATISGTSINATMPFATDVTALVASFSISGSAIQVGSTTQVSGTTANDFTNPVDYVVTALDGSSQTYTVTVTVGSNQAPIAASVAISGTESLGSTLTGSFSFTDPDGHSAGTHTYQWYRCADNTSSPPTNCTAISGAISTSYTITVYDNNKYLRFAVTPKDQYALTGSQAFSNPTGLFTFPIETLTGSGSTAGGTLTLNFTIPSGTTSVQLSSLRMFGDFDSPASEYSDVYFSSDCTGTNQGAVPRETARDGVADDTTSITTTLKEMGGIGASKTLPYTIPAPNWTAGSTFSICFDASIEVNTISPMYQYEVILTYTQ